MALLLKGPNNWSGTSALKGYDSWIDISSLQWGAARPVTATNTGGPPAAGRLTFADVIITKPLDSSTAAIARAMLQRGPIDTVEVVEVTSDTDIAGMYPMLSLKMFNVFVDGYSVSSGGDHPSESISLNFTRITGTTMTPDIKGNLVTGVWTYDALKG